MILENNRNPAAPLHCEKEYGRNFARLYDPLIKYAFLPFGGETRYRRGFVDFADIKIGEKVLDACCGTGTLTHEIAGRAGKDGEVTGVDLSTESLKIARSEKKTRGLPALFKRANCSDLPFPNEYFDKVCISFGMHEIDEADRPQSLLEFRRVLKKSGYFLVMDYHLPAGLLPRLALKLFMKTFEDEEACRMVFNRTLQPEMEKAGFAVLDRQLMGAGIMQLVRAAVK